MWLIFKGQNCVLNLIILATCGTTSRRGLSKANASLFWYMSWISLKKFWKRIYKETERKRKISEKKRIFSEKKSLLKNSLSYRKFSFHFLSTCNAPYASSNSFNSSNTSNASIFMFIYFFQEDVEKNSWKENFLWKSIFLEKFSFLSKIFLFLFRFLSFCKFSSKMFVMKPSYFFLF